MPDFNVRSDSVNVEQIMEQIRARIREKRGADYTEQQIRGTRRRQARKVPGSARRAIRSARAVPARTTAVQPARTSELCVRRRDAVRVASRAAPHHAEDPAADPEAVFQPEPADPGVEHPVAVEHDVRRTRGEARSRPSCVRSAALRSDAQPRAGNDAPRHRSQESQDARRVADEPAGIQRAARPGARKRRRLQTVARRSRRTTAAREAAA